MLRLLIYGVSGTPIFECGERLSSFYDLPLLTFELRPYLGDSYFDDKIPSIHLDMGDMGAGSSQSQLARDFGMSSKIKGLDTNHPVILPCRSVSDSELSSLLGYDQGICVTQIPDIRLVDWATDVVFFNCSDKNAISWFSKRLKCPSCGNVHHLEDLPPRLSGICDRCGTDLIRLPEDSPKFVASQFREWRNMFWRFEMYSKRKSFKAFAVDKFDKMLDLFNRVGGEYKDKISLCTSPQYGLGSAGRGNWYNRSLLDVNGGGLGPDDISFSTGLD